jgi:hypothetical protein
MDIGLWVSVVLQIILLFSSLWLFIQLNLRPKPSDALPEFPISCHRYQPVSIESEDIRINFLNCFSDQRIQKKLNFAAQWFVSFAKFFAFYLFCVRLFHPGRMSALLITELGKLRHLIEDARNRIEELLFFIDPYAQSIQNNHNFVYRCLYHCLSFVLDCNILAEETCVVSYSYFRQFYPKITNSISLGEFDKRMASLDDELEFIVNQSQFLELHCYPPVLPLGFAGRCRYHCLHFVLGYEKWFMNILWWERLRKSVLIHEISHCTQETLAGALTYECHGQKFHRIVLGAICELHAHIFGGILIFLTSLTFITLSLFSLFYPLSFFYPSTCFHKVSKFPLISGLTIFLTILISFYISYRLHPPRRIHRKPPNKL